MLALQVAYCLVQLMQARVGSVRLRDHVLHGQRDLALQLIHALGYLPKMVRERLVAHLMNLARPDLLTIVARLSAILAICSIFLASYVKFFVSILVGTRARKTITAPIRSGMMNMSGSCAASTAERT